MTQNILKFVAMVANAFSGLFQWLSTPLVSIIPPFLTPPLAPFLFLVPDLTIGSFMFGSGIFLFVGYVLIAWIIDILP